MSLNGEHHRAWSQGMRRRQEADEDSALAMGREFIKINQWLNGGALAALPVIAGALGFSGDRALQAFLWAGLFFAGGLACVSLATGLAYAAISYRADSRQVIVDAIESEADVMEGARPSFDSAAARERHKALHRSYARAAYAAFTVACLALLAFIAGVTAGGRQALNVLASL